jgi:hypothetical protein
MQWRAMSSGRGWAAGGLITATLWLGLLLGVSFLATPVKFLAPSLTLPVALDVGRHTFAVFNKVEWGLAILLLFLLLIGRRSWLGSVAAIIAALLVLVETVWLLPLLDQRVSLIIAGQSLPISSDHNVYIAIDVAKLVALALVAWVTARQLARPLPES